MIWYLGNLDASVGSSGAGKTGLVGKKRLKRKLRTLAESHADLERAHRRLAAHTEVLAIAVRSADHVPQRDLDEAVAGIHELTESATGSLRGS
jgi:hypothetical protein